MGKVFYFYYVLYSLINEKLSTSLLKKKNYKNIRRSYFLISLQYDGQVGFAVVRIRSLTKMPFCDT